MKMGFSVVQGAMVRYILDGSLKLDGQKECNTLGVNIKTAVERIDADSGISNGLEVLQ